MPTFCAIKQFLVRERRIGPFVNANQIEFGRVVVIVSEPKVEYIKPRKEQVPGDLLGLRRLADPIPKDKGEDGWFAVYALRQNLGGNGVVPGRPETDDLMVLCWQHGTPGIEA